MRHKSPGQLNTRCIRVRLPLYNKLKERALLNGDSMTDELDKLAGIELPRQVEFVPEIDSFRVINAPLIRSINPDIKRSKLIKTPVRRTSDGNA